MRDRQMLDCNCSDCFFMVRDSLKFKKSIELHHKWQLGHFNAKKQRLVDTANDYRIRKGDLEKWDKLITQSEKMKFQFNKKTAMINFGSCSKMNKDVSFIPNQLQLDTQECFKHRTD